MTIDSCNRACRLRFHLEGLEGIIEFSDELNTYRATKSYFRHQEMDSLPLWSIKHAIMTLNNPSGAEIMTAENVNHVQVSCNPKFMKAKA